MRPLPFLFLVLTLAASAMAGEPASAPSYPLWDGVESVADYAKKVNLPPTKTLDLGNDVKLELVLIPAGKFVMGTPEREKPVVGQAMAGISGAILLLVVAFWLFRARRNRKRPQFSIGLMLVMTFVAAIGVWGAVRWNEALKHPDNYPDEHPAHAVTLTQPFYMGKFDVTQAQYQAVIVTSPRLYKGKDDPIEMVSWDDAQVFCKRLTERTKQTIRLPTEAEWEYSCRAGSTTAYHSGDAEADLGRAAWYFGNSKNSTHPVGQKEANAFGLYDMHGNVWQWCQDWYAKDYYAKSSNENPQGPNEGAFRSVRGGSYGHYAPYCRTASRGRYVGSSDGGGFRVVVPAINTP